MKIVNSRTFNSGIKTKSKGFNITSIKILMNNEVIGVLKSFTTTESRVIDTGRFEATGNMVGAFFNTPIHFNMFDEPIDILVTFDNKSVFTIKGCYLMGPFNFTSNYIDCCDFVFEKIEYHE